MAYHRLMDRFPGIPLSEQRDLRAVATEYRWPRKGEWYISGAIPEAYQAPNDLAHPYYIAKIVRVKSVTTERVTEILT